MLDIDWVKRQDMPSILAIENASFDCPWSELEFLNYFRGKYSIGMRVKNDQGVIVGYMVYDLLPKQIGILNFAVHPEYRRQGIGTEMLNRLICKLTPKRSKLCADVSEKNLSMHLFLKSRSFVATEVIRNHYEDYNLDAYHFVYAIPPTDDDGLPHELEAIKNE